MESSLKKNKEPSLWIKKVHPPSIVIGDHKEIMITTRQYHNEINHLCYLSLTEPKNDKQALLDDYWHSAKINRSLFI